MEFIIITLQTPTLISTEADFMEHLEQFRSKFWGIVIFLLPACQNTTRQGDPFFMRNSADPGFAVHGDHLLYKRHPFTGIVVTCYPNGKDTPELEGFLDGKENGHRKRYYPGGQLKEIREFDKGFKTGAYTAWWGNGQKRLQYSFKDDEYQGTCREWNEDGLFIKEMNYQNGYEAGSQKMFYDNGKTQANYIILNGRRYGLLGTKNCINVSDSVFKN